MGKNHSSVTTAQGALIMPNIFAEILLAALRFAALWVLFNLLHRPRTKLRFVAAICVMVISSTLSRFLYFTSGRNFAASMICDLVLILSLAFFCKGESVSGNEKKNGELLKPVISALYFYGMLQLFNYILTCYGYAFNGNIPSSFSFWLYVGKTMEGLMLLLWTLFYYRLARNMNSNVPFSFSLVTIFVPLVGIAVIAASIYLFGVHNDFAKNDYAKDIFLYGGIFGTLIIILNMCVFYFYTKLSVAHEALMFANNLAHTPPVWTKDEGLSSAFIKKYEITQREKEVIEIMLTGKTDKGIAITLNIAVNTVQTHLKRIYQKTGAAGRFALSALIRGA
jgi:DNA-binding CsgD family transcriptional regulator